MQTAQQKHLKRVANRNDLHFIRMTREHAGKTVRPLTVKRTRLVGTERAALQHYDEMIAEQRAFPPIAHKAELLLPGMLLPMLAGFRRRRVSAATPRECDVLGETTAKIIGKAF